MRRLKKWHRRFSGLTTRQGRTIKQSRKLTVTINRAWVGNEHHRRHQTKIIPEYKTRGKDWPMPHGSRPGKTLRNKKHHIPKYKFERLGIADVNFNILHYTTDRWWSGRIDWIKLQRAMKNIHPEYIDYNIQPHWWKV